MPINGCSIGQNSGGIFQVWVGLHVVTVTTSLFIAFMYICNNIGRTCNTSRDSRFLPQNHTSANSTKFLSIIGRYSNAGSEFNLD
jgi:hypothetical protein